MKSFGERMFHRTAEAAVGLGLALLCMCVAGVASVGDDGWTGSPTASTCPLGADDPAQCPIDPFLPM